MCETAGRLLAAAAVAAMLASCSSDPEPSAPGPASAPVSVAEPLEAPAGPVRHVTEFMTGDECLFCHREKVGRGWDSSTHNLTVHDAGLLERDGEPPPGAELALGARQPRHWLRTTDRYGILAIRTAAGTWDESVFGDSCAGCHASGVDPATGAFAATSLDCFVCHGDVALEHTTEPALVHLSRWRDDDPAVVVSICGQCHLRGGRSRTTGRPWPRGFVAGDALLDDFEFDFSDGALAALSVADRHVAENVRDVILRGRTAVTCLSCHTIHGDPNPSHHRLEETEACFTCHVRGEGPSSRHPLTRSSPVCELDEGA